MATRQEEIIVKMGADMKTLTRELNMSRQQVSAWSKEIKEELNTRLPESWKRYTDTIGQLSAKTKDFLKGMVPGGESAGGHGGGPLAGLGHIIGGAAILHGIHKVLDAFDELDKRAQNLGISTDFLQGIQHISSKEAVGGVETFNMAITQLSVKLGEAKNGGEDAIKNFEKWGITMEDIKSMDTEELFYKIAQRLHDIPDPAERTALAFDLMGRAGKNMSGVMSGGADALHKMVDAVDKLDEEKIKSIAEAKKNVEDLGHTAVLWGGKTIGFIGNLAKSLGNLSMGMTPGLAKFLEHANAPGKKGPDVDETELAANAAKLTAAAREYNYERFKGGNAETKLLGLLIEQGDLQSDIKKLSGESVEKYKLQEKLMRVQNDIASERATIEKTAADKKLKADKEASDRAKKQQQEDEKAAKSRERIEEQIAKLKNKISRAESKEFMPTIEELAQTGIFRQQANRLLWLQNDAKDATLWGDKRGLGQDLNEIKSIRQNLSKAGVYQDPNQGMIDELQVLTEKVKNGEGIPIAIENMDD